MEGEGRASEKAMVTLIKGPTEPGQTLRLGLQMGLSASVPVTSTFDLYTLPSADILIPLIVQRPFALPPFSGTIPSGSPAGFVLKV